MCYKIFFFNPQAPSRTLHSNLISKKIQTCTASLNQHFSPFYNYFAITCLLLYDRCILIKLEFPFRILWFILFCFACYYGYLLYTPFLNSWYNEPTVIATDQADFPVEKVPFPAITICSNNKIVYRQLESVLRMQPWKGLTNLNYNITQETNNGMFNNNLQRGFYQ